MALAPELDKDTALALVSRLEDAQMALDSLSPFCTVFSDEYRILLSSFISRLAELGQRASAGNSYALLKQHVFRLYRELQANWLDRVITAAEGNKQIGLIEDTVARLVRADHLFFKEGAAKPYSAIHPHLIMIMQQDLEHLEILGRLPLASWLERLGMATAGISDYVGSLDSAKVPTAPWHWSAAGQALENRLIQREKWSNMTEVLADFVYQHGVGIFRGNPAFRLQTDWSEARLEPIRDFSVFPLSWFTGSENRIQIIEKNTQQLLKGYRAHNVLLWGPRGCGKSSLIRGLIAKYYDKGLRGIEIPVDVYGAIPELYNIVRGRREFFIAVLDNISLHRDEAIFRTLASVLEGTLEAVPQNLVFYATSNFKDLVDRQGERPQGLARMQMDADELAQNTLISQSIRPLEYDPQQNERQDEQRAIDDRFALKVFIDLPHKKEYEKLVMEYARRAGIEEPEQEILEAFQVWRMRHQHDLVGGRTARDFIIAAYPKQASRLMDLFV